MKVNQTWFQVLGSLCMELTPSITNQHILFCYLILLCKYSFISLFLAAPHSRQDPTGVGTCVPCSGSVCMSAKLPQLWPTLCNSMDCSLPVHGIVHGIPRQEYWMGCHFLLQEIFLTQGLNPGPPHWRQTLYHLSHQGSPLQVDSQHLFSSSVCQVISQLYSIYC